MSISALPPSTVRLLGSSINITSPCDLVKELLDNAIDADATMIQIVMSSNTVDKIQVRDNGRGIRFGDFDALGKRAHTSKLRSFDELQTRGVQTLGFRGDAIASANSLAAIRIITRTVEDPVATRLLLKPGAGGIQERQPTSAPVGTTIQALKLFEGIPVRKQQALKASAKTKIAVKVLLESYALARPNIKLSFKDEEHPGPSWSCIPAQSQGVHERVLQIWNSSLANQCIQQTMSTDCGAFVLDVFMPKLDCDIESAQSKGAFISVDGRPISSTRGIGRRLAIAFKRRLSQACRVGNDSPPVSNPFMQLNIRCRPGSYDANVTPMKDEVLISDEGKVLQCFERMCEDAYSRPISSPAFQAIDPPPKFPDPLDISIDLTEDGIIDHLTDQGLLEALEDQNDKKRKVIPDVPAHAGEGPQGELAHSQPVASKGTTIAAMTEDTHTADSSTSQFVQRTAVKVNMARTDSNSTDDDCLAGSMDIDALKRAAVIDLRARLPESKSPQRNSSCTRASQNIKRYLVPSSGSSLFQIATDETATPTSNPDPLLELELPSRGGKSIRQPLQELRESALNQLQEERVSSPQLPVIELGDQTINMPASRGRHAPLGGVRASRAHNDGDVHGRTINPRRVTVTESSSAETVEIFASSSPVAQGIGMTDLPSPPPTDPSIRRFRSARDVLLSQARGQSDEQNSNGRIGESRISGRSHRQRRPAREQLSPEPRGTIATPGRNTTSERPSAQRLGPFPTNMASHHGIGVFSSPSVYNLEESHHDTTPWSHDVQLSLMQTPAPQTVNVTSIYEDMKVSHRLDGIDDSVERRKLVSPGQISRHGSAANDLIQPVNPPIGGAPSQSLLKKASTRGDLHRASLNVDIRHEDIKRQLLHLRYPETRYRGSSKPSLRSSIPWHSSELEKKIRNVINNWAKRQSTPVRADYNPVNA